MPISRKKSCVQCRVAKARCNLASPCSRCSERCLQCNYANAFRSSNQVPTTGRQAGTSQRDTLVDIDTQGSPFSNYGPMNDIQFTEDNQDLTGLRVEDITWPTPEWSDSNLFRPLSAGFTRGSFSEILEQPDRQTLNLMSANRSPTQSPSIIRQASKEKQNGCQSLNSNDLAAEGIVVIYGKAYHDILSRRQSATTQSFLMTQVIWGQLKTYPTMMIQGQLPPFIYPSCVLNDILPKNCIINGIHQCLPNPLANCASLISMFQGRTPANSPFLWKSIYSELERLKNEYHNYDNHDLLASLQAISIYVLLRVQDLQSRQIEEFGSMMMTIIDIAKQLSQSTNFKSNIYKNESLSHREWAFSESLRRTCCLLYITENLLEAIIARADPVRCGGFDPIPVPCPRVLWDYDNSEAWAHRLNRFKADGQAERVLTIRDLKDSGFGQAASQDVDKGLVQAMARWCEGIDELGNLLWMIILLN